MQPFQEIQLKRWKLPNATTHSSSKALFPAFVYFHRAGHHTQTVQRYGLLLSSWKLGSLLQAMALWEYIIERLFILGFHFLRRSLPSCWGYRAFCLFILAARLVPQAVLIGQAPHHPQGELGSLLIHLLDGDVCNLFNHSSPTRLASAPTTQEWPQHQGQLYPVYPTLEMFLPYIPKASESCHLLSWSTFFPFPLECFNRSSIWSAGQGPPVLPLAQAASAPCSLCVRLQLPTSRLYRPFLRFIVFRLYPLLPNVHILLSLHKRRLGHILIMLSLAIPARDNADEGFYLVAAAFVIFIYPILWLCKNQPLIFSGLLTIR